MTRLLICLTAFFALAAGLARACPPVNVTASYGTAVNVAADPVCECPAPVNAQARVLVAAPAYTPSVVVGAGFGGYSAHAFAFRGVNVHAVHAVAVKTVTVERRGLFGRRVQKSVTVVK